MSDKKVLSYRESERQIITGGIIIELSIIGIPRPLPVLSLSSKSVLSLFQALKDRFPVRFIEGSAGEFCLHRIFSNH